MLTLLTLVTLMVSTQEPLEMGTASELRGVKEVMVRVESEDEVSTLVTKERLVKELVKGGIKVVKDAPVVLVYTGSRRVQDGGATVNAVRITDDIASATVTPTSTFVLDGKGTVLNGRRILLIHSSTRVSGYGYPSLDFAKAFLKAWKKANK